jgi:hypothetical protein
MGYFDKFGANYFAYVAQKPCSSLQILSRKTVGITGI